MNKKASSKKSTNTIMKKIFNLLLLLTMFATTALAQVQYDNVKIPADTRLYLQSLENGDRQMHKRSMDPTAQQQEAKLFVSCAPDADTKAIEAQIKAVGATPRGTIGRYIMVSTPVSAVSKIADINDVTYISKGPNVSLKTHVSREVTGVNNVLKAADGLPQAYTGKGVVVGVIDTGFDYQHPSFKDAEGNLRIKALYIPGLMLKEGDDVVTTLDGTELEGKAFTQPEEILALESDSKDGSHGSHCAAIAAGSTFDWAGGMAPDADLVLCPSAVLKEGEEDNADNLAYRIMQGILFIRDYARRVGKPYVISMSLNSHDGPHDGTSLGASMLEQLARENTNMAMATGNEGYVSGYVTRAFVGNDTLHTVLSGVPMVFAFTRKPGDMNFQIGIFDRETQKETWRSQPLSSADGGCSFMFQFDDRDDKTTPYEDIRSHLAAFAERPVTFSLSKLEDGRSKMSFVLLASPHGNRYTFHITCPEDNVVDMWCDGSDFVTVPGSDYYTGGLTSVSMGDFVTGGTIISVGSWAAKDKFVNIKGEEVEDDNPKGETVVGEYSSFSSFGTDIAGHNHPYVSAPGTLVISALNHFDSDYSPDGFFYNEVKAKDDDGFLWGPMSGTSMATPTVAGIIALWLEAKPDLTYEEIREAIAATATKDEFTEAAPIHYGHGKIDAYKGLLHMLGIPSSIPTLSKQQPMGVTFRMNDGRLFIEGAEDGTPIRIYTTDGRIVASAPLTEGRVCLPAGCPAGVYAVQVGSLGSTLIRTQ